MTAALLAALVVGCGDAGGPGAPAPAVTTVDEAAADEAAADEAAAADGADDDAATTETPRTRPARPSAERAREVLDPDAGWALTATGPEVVVRDAPDGAETHRLANPTSTGAPLTLLLADDAGDGWYEVYVPVRPNGTTGWVDADDVDAARVPYRLVMDVDANELTLYDEGRAVRTMPAASGTGGTPTPRGLFYLTELLVPTNSGYGPYAYGLSGYSEVLTSFGGGPGQIGLHGTDDASSVGRAVSNGCIRLSDADITYLAETLPLGTPVEIV